MSQVLTSDDLRRLPEIVVGEFKAAFVDEIVPAVGRGWEGRAIELDVIDTGTYLHGIAAGEPTESGGAITVIVETKPAAGYAAAIKRGRGGNYDYVGQRAAEEGVRNADPDIRAALDRAGDRVR